MGAAIFKKMNLRIPMGGSGWYGQRVGERKWGGSLGVSSFFAMKMTRLIPLVKSVAKTSPVRADRNERRVNRPDR